MNLVRGINIKLFGALLVLGCALAFNAQWIRQGTLEMGGDEFEYDSLARHIIAGQGFVLSNGQPTAYRTPGFPLILGVVYCFCGGNIAVARVLLMILTSLTALGIYALCLSVFDDFTVALIGGIDWALMVMTVKLSGLLYGESSAGLILIASLFFAVLSKKYESNAFACTAGILMGFAILTRGYLLPILVGPLIWLFIWNKRLSLAFFLFSMLLPGLWIARNTVRVQTVTLSTETSIGLWAGNNAWTRGAWAGYDWMSPNPEQLQHMRSKYVDFDYLSEVEKSRRYGNEFVTEIINNPRRIAWLIPRKVAIYLSPSSYMGFDWAYAVLLPFSLIGVIGLWKNQGMRHLLWLVRFPIIGVMMICILTFGDSRFRHPVNPLFAILAAIGLKTLIGKMNLGLTFRRT